VSCRITAAIDHQPRRSNGHPEEAADRPSAWISAHPRGASSHHLEARGVHPRESDPQAGGHQHHLHRGAGGLRHHPHRGARRAHQATQVVVAPMKGNVERAVPGQRVTIATRAHPSATSHPRFDPPPFRVLYILLNRV